MKIKCTDSYARAFTRTDLVVVTGIVAVFVIIFIGIMRSHESHEEVAHRVQCLDNIKQVGDSLLLYAREFDGKLPDVTTNNPAYYGTYWPWDLNTNLVSELQKEGVTRPLLHCPANPAMNDDVHWNFWKYFPGSSVRVVGYVFLLRGGIEVPEHLWRVGVDDGGRGDRSTLVLVSDAVASTDGDYTKISGRLLDRTSHLHGSIPLGGNILFLDGHAEWRAFEKMQPQFTVDGGVNWFF